MAVFILVGLTHPGAGGFKQDATFLFMAEAFPGREEQQANLPASIVLGGQHYRYTEQDWNDHQDSLLDALSETYLAMFYAPDHATRGEYARGYLRLLAHRSSPSTFEAHWHYLTSLSHYPAA